MNVRRLSIGAVLIGLLVIYSSVILRLNKEPALTSKEKVLAWIKIGSPHEDDPAARQGG